MKKTLLLVCSHGGHLAEMLQLQEAFANCRAVYFCYDAETTRPLPNAYRVPNKPTSPIELARNLVRLARLFRRERPNLMISTGAEIAVPAALVAKCFRVPIIHIECGAQVYSPSLTGRVLYYLADRFYVQWPELLDAFGRRARFAGSFIDGGTRRTAA